MSRGKAATFRHTQALLSQVSVSSTQLWQGAWGHTVSWRCQQGNTGQNHLQQTKPQPDTRVSPGLNTQAPTIRPLQQMKQSQQRTLPAAQQSCQGSPLLPGIAPWPKAVTLGWPHHTALGWLGRSLCQEWYQSLFHNARCPRCPFTARASPNSLELASLGKSGHMALCFACPGFAGTATRDRFHTQSVSWCKNSSGSATSPALSEESQGPLKRGFIPIRATKISAHSSLNY